MTVPTTAIMCIATIAISLLISPYAALPLFVFTMFSVAGELCIGEEDEDGDD